MKMVEPGLYMDEKGEYCMLADPIICALNVAYSERNGEIRWLPQKEEDVVALKEAINYLDSSPVDYSSVLGILDNLKKLRI